MSADRVSSNPTLLARFLGNTIAGSNSGIDRGVANAVDDVRSAIHDSRTKSPEQLQAAVDESRAELARLGMVQVKSGAHKGEWWPQEKAHLVEGKKRRNDDPSLLGQLTGSAFGGGYPTIEKGVARAVDDFTSAWHDAKTLSAEELQARVDESRAELAAKGMSQVQSGMHKGEWWPNDKIHLVEGKEKSADHPTLADKLIWNFFGRNDPAVGTGVANAVDDVRSAWRDAKTKTPEELQAAVDESRAELAAKGMSQVQSGAHKGEWWPQDKIHLVEGKEKRSDGPSILGKLIGSVFGGNDLAMSSGIANGVDDVRSAWRDAKSKTPEELQAAVDESRAELAGKGMSQVKSGAHKGEWWPNEKLHLVEGK